jgi:hypothetical protein
MGVLEDAIREHLELKRKHGVSDEDLAQQEAEALGPARREPAPEEAEEGAEHAEGAEAEPAASEQGQEGAEAEQPHEEEPGAGEPDLEAVHPPPEPEAMEPHPPEPQGDGAAVEPEEPVPAEPDDDATRFYDAEHEPASGQDTPPSGFPSVGEDEDAGEEPAARKADQPEEDVLEETPDFLQETPDHDRLWFEQRPPRDFDFD